MSARESTVSILAVRLAIVCVLSGCSQTTPSSGPISKTEESATRDHSRDSHAQDDQTAELQTEPAGDGGKAGQDTGASGAEVVESSVSQVSGGAWPNWMGPRHDGVSFESGWSTDWPQDGLPVVWSRAIGIGFSSVSISGGRLFSMGHIDGQEFVQCLQSDTGQPVWSFSYRSPLVDNLHDGGPGATPTIDGAYVYTLGRGGQLYCFRADDGTVVWSRMLQEDLDVPLPEWGFTSSPFILDGQLILEAGRVVSYNKLTGVKNWQTDRHEAGYGSAARLESDGMELLATLDCDGLRIVRASDGGQVAFQPWESPFLTNSTTPIVQGDRIYVSSGYNVGCGLFRFSGGQLTSIYSNRDMRNHFNNSILLDGHLYGFDGNSNLGRVVQLTCMEWATGDVKWKQRGLGCGSLMVADGKLLLLSEDGDLVVSAASPNGYSELCRSRFLDGRCWTVPLLLDGCVYGRNAAGRLVCARLPRQK
ncbi:MAG: PQQ-binding-like beta-propeller repeat protein [Planctomycetaceae bacterium]